MRVPSQSPVLVVDDDRTIREFLRDLLIFEDFTVHTAIHGADALQRLTAGLEPCLILLDLKMPVMDGIALYLAMQDTPPLNTIPVLFLSAMQEAQQRLEAIGVDAYIAIPINAHTLNGIGQHHQCAGAAPGRKTQILIRIISGSIHGIGSKSYPL